MPLPNHSAPNIGWRLAGPLIVSALLHTFIAAFWLKPEATIRAFPFGNQRPASVSAHLSASRGGASIAPSIGVARRGATKPSLKTRNERMQRAREPDITRSSTSSESVGEDSSAPANAGSIDLDAAFQMARQQARQAQARIRESGDSTSLSLERETALGKAIVKSVRAKCISDHAGLGLLAAPVLLADAMRENGCRW